ncbi:superfamily I DNA/RNA helicase [Spiroplasma sabaudiense Ar-1343]|uniref:Superfamily I DNA/RNA helicase n=1 Tax=Spiroplasma sabaudiense Ar-1343 TaxID=1276257 RepID=W6AK70_9MOLU|nr:AAA domain-containing protein [Spiroplasma sabaudiense]AHI54124.1 superfamily I DNA/RNA helicase [Spiroplasma sabaudiense Ar-1343]
MKNEILSEGKELFFDFFLLKNQHRENLAHLDSKIKNLNITNITKISELEGFFRNTVIKSIFLCLVDDKVKTVGIKQSKSGQKQVYNVLLRIEFANIYQQRFAKGTFLGIAADLDPNKPVINVKNVFVTKMTNQPQDFETSINNCRVQVLTNSSDISGEEILSRNLINSATIPQIKKLLSNFEIESAEWENYLNYLEDNLILQRGESLPYLGISTQNVLKVEASINKNLDQKFVLFKTASFIYYSISQKAFLDINKIKYELVLIASVDLIDSIRKNHFEQIKTLDDLFLISIAANKKTPSLIKTRSNIKNLFDFESLGENLTRLENKILLGSLVGVKLKNDFLDYWKINKETVLGELNKNINEIDDLNFVKDLCIKEVSYEINDYDLALIKENDLINGLKNGYLAYLGIGDETLINRSRNIINRIRSGNVKNPYLANYLFNTKSVIVNSQENDINIEDIKFHYKLNGKQKSAVIKALNSKDIFLIQGPPGTGKTQVIAEIAYQLASQKKKILISSQNHEAINNVINRLPSKPDLFKLRLSNISFLENRQNNNFSIEKLLLNYYKSIGKVVNDNLFQNGADLDQALKELSNIDKLIGEFHGVKKRSEEVLKITSEINEIKDKIEAINLQNANNNIMREDLEDQLFYIDNIIEAIKNKFYDGIIPNFAAFEKIYNLILKEHLDLLFSRFEKELSKNLFDNMKFIYNFLVFQNQDYKNFLILKEKLHFYQKNGDFTKVVETEQKLNEVNSKISQDKYINNLNILFEKFSRYLLKEKEKLQEVSKAPIFQGDIDSLRINLNQLELERKKIKASVSEVLGQMQILTENFNQNYGEDLDLLSEDAELVLQNKFEEIGKKITVFNLKKTKLKGLYEKTLDFLKNNYEIEFNKHDVSKKMNIQLLSETRKHILNIIDNLTNIYAMTLNSPAKFHFEKNQEAIKVGIESLDLINLDIDTVIIDEASKATLLEIMMPLVFGKNLILVGDYRQLPPLIKITKEEVDRINLNFNKKYDFDSLFNLLDKSIFKKLISDANSSVRETLQIQYRSNEQIMNIVNNFYDDYLRIEPKTSLDKFHNINIDSDLGNNIINPDNSVYWIESSYNLNGEINFEKSESYSKSLFNDLEIDTTIFMIKKINQIISEKHKNFFQKPTLAIISMYALHAQKLRKKYQKIANTIQDINVVISTVDDFQGKEADYVIVNLVRNPEKISKHGQKFIKQFERINVAFSRAQKLLIIIGATRTTNGTVVPIPSIENPLRVKNKAVYDDILAYITFNNGYKTIQEIYE